MNLCTTISWKLKCECRHRKHKLGQKSGSTIFQRTPHFLSSCFFGFLSLNFLTRQYDVGSISVELKMILLVSKEKVRMSLCVDGYRQFSIFVAPTSCWHVFFTLYNLPL